MGVGPASVNYRALQDTGPAWRLSGKSCRECARLEVEVLTLFAFSSENWRRPSREVRLLMDLFLSTLKQEIDKLHTNNVATARHRRPR